MRAGKEGTGVTAGERGNGVKAGESGVRGMAGERGEKGEDEHTYSEHSPVPKTTCRHNQRGGCRLQCLH